MPPLGARGSAPGAIASELTGPIVAGFLAVFAENWLECAGELLVDGGSYANEVFPDAASDVCGLVVGSTPTAGRSTRARILVQLLLASARDSIELCSPYFVPDLGIRRELLAARNRGVRVRIITGGPYGDHGSSGARGGGAMARCSKPTSTSTNTQRG